MTFLWAPSESAKPTFFKSLYKYKSFAQYPLSAGLPQSLVEFNNSLNKKIDSNFIYVLIHHPSTLFESYSLSTVRELLSIDEKSGFNAGHVQLAWSCNIKGKLKESAIGFTGDTKSQSISLAKSGFGLPHLLLLTLMGNLSHQRL